MKEKGDLESCEEYIATDSVYRVKFFEKKQSVLEEAR